MSDDDFYHSYTLRGDWAYIAAYISMNHLIAGLRSMPLKDKTGVLFHLAANDVALLSIIITGAKGMTYITETCKNDPDLKGLLSNIEASATVYTKYVQALQRLNRSQQFNQILDEYYRRWEDGNNTKLSELAKEYGVNYGSLRQAKIRYDAERRKSVSD